MFSKICCTILLATLTLPALAQEEKRWELIPVLGGNMSYERNWAFQTSPRYGLYVGGRVQYALTKRFVVGTGLIYSEKGVAFDVGFPDANGNIITTSNVVFRYNYLEVPLYMGVPFKLSKRFTLLPTLAWNTSLFVHGKVWFKGVPRQNQSSTVSPGFSYDLGTVLSVAGIYRVGKYSILGELRYNPSFRTDSYLFGLNTGLVF